MKKIVLIIAIIGLICPSVVFAGAGAGIGAALEAMGDALMNAGKTQQETKTREKISQPDDYPRDPPCMRNGSFVECVTDSGCGTYSCVCYKSESSRVTGICVPR